jgi:N-carbamoylputrescine amidase
MKVTVCELPNEPATLEEAWLKICTHVRERNSELVLLPEMPFYRWLASSSNENAEDWAAAVQAHQEWIKRLEELAPATVISTRPTLNEDIRQNVGFVWDQMDGVRDVHPKYYLPDEPGFWEATWYSRGNREFTGFQTANGKIGFQICTEIWFAQHAREYSKQGVQLIVCPRATPHSTVKKWIAGGQVAAVISGAFCLSSNLSWKSTDGSDYSGVGWIIGPEEGQILGLTSSEQPFLTLDIDLAEADRAKHTYPRYVLD